MLMKALEALLTRLFHSFLALPLKSFHPTQPDLLRDLCGQACSIPVTWNTLIFFLYPFKFSHCL